MLAVFLRYAWPYLLAMVVGSVLWYSADHFCNTACRNQKDAARDAEQTLDLMKQQIREANQKAEVERARDEDISRSAAAAASVQVEAANVRAANAESDAAKLLAAHRAVLARIELPGVVRDAYNGGIRFTPKADADTGKPADQGSATGTAPVAADVYVGVCTRNRIAMDKLADDYDQLRAVADANFIACTRKDKP